MLVKSDTVNPRLHQKLPGAGPAREQLREKGQFWTPDWVAQAMVAYVLQDGADEIFDPAVGAGAFFRAAKFVAGKLGRPIRLRGRELDLEALEEAVQNGLSRDDLMSVEISDFLLEPPLRTFKAIVANPPYIRHHRLSLEMKERIKAFGKNLFGTALDGRAGLHVYFLLYALEILEKDGRLAFIMPADTCEGKFAPTLWNWITRHYRLEHIISFAPEATPFPLVDTNAIIFMIRKATPATHFLWSRCVQPQTTELTTWALTGFANIPPANIITVQKRELKEALTTGFSRPHINEPPPTSVLSDFAKVMRGIATGANEFFFLTKEQAHDLGIPDSYLRTAIGRTRDVDGNEVTNATLDALNAANRPTRLLSLNGQSLESFPPSIRKYLKQGDEQGLPQRPLIAQRRPWYKMEVRPVPPILFAYLGRRSTRFIRNFAGVVPLTCFLCIYPHSENPDYIDQLWRVLQHPNTVANLARVGKSYGSGAIKVEPRALDQLPIPEEVLVETGLCIPERATQLFAW